MSDTVPASFLPGGRKRRKLFADEPMLDVPDPGQRMVLRGPEAWPDGTPQERRQWAEAVYLLTGQPGRSRPMDWGCVAADDRATRGAGVTPGAPRRPLPSAASSRGVNDTGGLMMLAMVR